MYTVTMDIDGLTLDEYKAVAIALGPEARSAAGILLHIATQTDSGYRIVEIWDTEDGFQAFVEKYFGPVMGRLGIYKQPTISITPLHDFFVPRIGDLETVGSLPGTPSPA
jgi:hypothetical protein